MRSAGELLLLVLLLRTHRGFMSLRWLLQTF
jgi:hypothetical protein